MELDREHCRRASEARDRRFDGVFFCGVVTTGIYCRPICPVALPKPQNVDYYPSAAACEEAGFRPCRRCRPETAPGTPAWQGTSTTVARALGLIERTPGQRWSVEDLSERLGVGSRHLRRLFAQHLGASPLAVMRTRRVHFARRLIDETALPMVEVAVASGFSSVRRFNESIRATFGRPPTALRKKSSGVDRGGPIELRLPYRPPFDWRGLADFLALRAIPGVEAVTPEGYARVIDTDDGPGWIEVRPDPHDALLWMRVHVADSRALAHCVECARRLFDLSANPLRIEQDLRADPLLAPRLRANAGGRVPGAWDPFELAVRAVLGQQVSVKGATTLAGRLVRAFGKPLELTPAPGLTHLFPGPEVLADADVAGIGMPRARGEAIRALARAVAEGAWRFDDGADAVRDGLAAIRGIGDWTAQYVAMRGLGDSDAFPASDLGLIRAVSQGGPRISPSALLARAEAWRPWRAYAAVLLWRT